jgi:hypothetical protein
MYFFNISLIIIMNDYHTKFEDKFLKARENYHRGKIIVHQVLNNFKIKLEFSHREFFQELDVYIQ